MATKIFTKKHFFIKLIFTFFLILNFSKNPLIAQETENQVKNQVKNQTESQREEDKNYFAQKEGEETLIFQTLKWEAGKYVKMYQVFVEIYDETFGWLPYEQPENSPTTADITVQEFLGNGIYKTTENQLILALYAKENGDSQKYRYSVTLYNLLGQAAFSTEPMEFEIKKAFIPEIYSSSKEIVYLDSIYDGGISLRGKNFLPTTQFTLSNNLANIPLLKADVSQKEDKADLIFDETLFDTGSWTIKAENPGGFTAEIPFEIRFQKPIDYVLALGFAPSISVMGKSYKNYFPIIAPLAVNARFEVMPFKRRFGFFGFGLSGNYFQVENQNSQYKISTKSFAVFLNGVYHKVFGNKKFRFQSRLGAGVVGFLGMHFNFTNGLSSPEFTTFYLAANIGCSLSYYINSSFFVDIGFDWQQVFMPNEISGFVVPSLSVGYQF